MRRSQRQTEVKKSLNKKKTFFLKTERFEAMRTRLKQWAYRGAKFIIFFTSMITLSFRRNLNGLHIG